MRAVSLAAAEFTDTEGPFTILEKGIQLFDGVAVQMLPAGKAVIAVIVCGQRNHLNTSVSYTHLDVYKRQVYRQPFR